MSSLEHGRMLLCAVADLPGVVVHLYTVHLVVGNGSNHNLVLNTLSTLSVAEV